MLQFFVPYCRSSIFKTDLVVRILEWYFSAFIYLSLNERLLSKANFSTMLKILFAIKGVSGWLENVTTLLFPDINAH